MLKSAPPAPPARGFSLIELMVVLSIMALLVMAAMPSFSTWVRNVKVRAVADDLQNALRTAQAEAVRRSRQMVFVRTGGATDAVSSLSASADGARWAIVALPLGEGNSAAIVEVGALGDAAAGVSITGSANALCFNSLGRLTANASVSTSVANAGCTVSGGGSGAEFDITVNGADKPLKVTVALGGQVRLCDPAFTLSADTPYGCP